MVASAPPVKHAGPPVDVAGSRGTARAARLGTPCTAEHRGAGGTCRVCCGPASAGYSMCRACSVVAVALGCAPVAVTPVAVVDGESSLYRALRQYKSGVPSVARRQATRLAVLLTRFWARHGRCVAPGGVDVAAVVPSGPGGRPVPHPFEGVVRACPSMPRVISPLVAGEVPVTHLRPDPGAYEAGDVAGLRVLLLDDVYTTGAHLQSAARALVESGVAEVRAVVVGRFVDPGP